MAIPYPLSVLRVAAVIGAAFLAMVSTGCTSITGFPNRSTSVSKDLAAVSALLQPSAITSYLAQTDPEKRRAARNEIIEARIWAADLNFAQFEKAIYREGIGLGIGSEWAVLGLNAYGAVQNSAKGVSAAAGAITGSRTAFDKDALYGKTLPLLLNQAVTNRSAVLARIRLGLLQDDASYPLARGLADLEDYYHAGTIPGALNGISANTSAQADVANKELKKLALLTPVTAELSARKRVLADYVKTINEAQVNTLAAAVGLPSGIDAKDALLDAIMDSTTPAQLDKYAVPAGRLAGKTF